jgi:hypothetical protein
MGTFKLPNNIQSIRTGNYADYESFSQHGLITCGWMDLHSDDGQGCDETNQYFTIKIRWVNKADNPVLIYSEDRNKFIKHYPKIGEVIRFNAYNYHGLIPNYYAAFLNKYHEQDSDTAFSNIRVLSNILTSPKLIWEWHK